MPKMTPPEDAPEIWKWMLKYGVTLERLAPLVGVTRQHLSDVRRGAKRPSDGLKTSIATATADLERELGVSRPKGVPVVVWFAETRGAS